MKTLGPSLLLSACLISLANGVIMTNARKAKIIDDTLCPKVKPMRFFDLPRIEGGWAFQQYFASSEEALAYHCMRGEMKVEGTGLSARVIMTFQYGYIDDPDADMLQGNMTWVIPDIKNPAHWEHAEQPYEGVYNTYVLDTDYKDWMLLLHCAEKKQTPRYLSSIIMSRRPEPLGAAVLSYLRDKLAKYHVPLEFMFPVEQVNCTSKATSNRFANIKLF
ncbi:uncharacterized protein LOC132202211 [Neocloeon triangulifer]|uniref:uncharacterized protein LOC132202211 n=1 Tax=Neocloeon triangulifer TaxID=2078957 RepID=UPI00286ED6FE|nr:uncharacterized protein LOC132202211 [Neocloeon triangulifer]